VGASVAVFLILSAAYGWYFLSYDDGSSGATNTRILDTLFWLVCIAALLGNAAIFRARASGYAAGDAAVLKEADGIVKAFVLYLGGLFLLGTVGTALGLSGGGLAIMKRGNSLTAFDVVYFVAFAVMLVRATWWVYLQDGADLLAQHHRMFRFPRSKTGVLLLWTIALLVLAYGVLDRIVSDPAQASYGR